MIRNANPPTLDLIAMAEKFGARNYDPLRVVLCRGAGSRVWDVEGREYLDFLSSYSALNFGHGHPEMLKALEVQARNLTVCSRAFHSQTLSLFCRELAEFCGMEKVLLMNTGAEAVETSLKLARKWGYECKKVPSDTARIIVMEGAFHGRTVTLVSFSSEMLYRNGFGPFTPGFDIVPFGDVEAVERALTPSTVGVLIEPVQAESGIRVPKPGTLARLSEVCRKHQILLMLDEIQTGLGRCGRDFCFQYENIHPDILILGKSLGGGMLPVSAVLSSARVMQVIRPGEHGSTFGGNPLACAVGREALKLLRRENLSQRAARLGENVLSFLRAAKLPHVVEIRGVGLLVGVEMALSAGGARRYCEKMAEKGLLCKETHENVIRMAPPLTIDEDDLERGLKIVRETIKELG